MQMEHPDHDRVHRVTDDYRDMCREEVRVTCERCKCAEVGYCDPECKLCDVCYAYEQGYKDGLSDTRKNRISRAMKLDEVKDEGTYTYAKCTICGTNHVLGLMCPNINKHSEVL